MEYCYYMSPNIYHIETLQIKYLDRYKVYIIQFIIFCTIKTIPKKTDTEFDIQKTVHRNIFL